MTKPRTCRICGDHYFVRACPGCWLIRSWAQAKTPRQRAMHQRRVLAYLGQRTAATGGKERQ